VWVACHGFGLVRVDPLSRDVTATVPRPGGRHVGAVLTTDDPFEFVGVTLDGSTLWVSDVSDAAGRFRVLSVESATPRP
jgi:hypothetical protein